MVCINTVQNSHPDHPPLSCKYIMVPHRTLVYDGYICTYVHTLVSHFHDVLVSPLRTSLAYNLQWILVNSLTFCQPNPFIPTNAYELIINRNHIAISPRFSGSLVPGLLFSQLHLILHEFNHKHQHPNTTSELEVEKHRERACCDLW